MKQRKIGDRHVSALGYGAMYLSVDGRPPQDHALHTLTAVIEVGLTFIDTADVYGLDDRDIGHNERLIARALRAAGPNQDAIVVATKGGRIRRGEGWGLDGRPVHLRRACEASLRALGREPIDLYQLHRPDPQVPFEETIGTLADLQREGKIHLIGLSNVSSEELEAARRLITVTSVQNKFNFWQRQDEENGLLATCLEHGIAYLPYSPFGGGKRAGRLGEIAAVAQVAARHGVTPYQVTLAWLLAKAPVIIPIPCSRRVEGVRENSRAADCTLTVEDLRALDAAVPPA